VDNDDLRAKSIKQAKQLLAGAISGVVTKVTTFIH
jgi:hypothetical protein